MIELRKSLFPQRQKIAEGQLLFQKRSYIFRTSAITDTYPWRDTCQRSEAEPARSMTRVGVRWIALFAFYVFCSVSSPAYAGFGARKKYKTDPSALSKMTTRIQTIFSFPCSALLVRQWTNPIIQNVRDIMENAAIEIGRKLK